MEGDLLYCRPVKNNRRKSAGSIFSFVPAHGGSRAGAVAEQLSRTLTEGPGSAVLLVDFRGGDFPLWQNSDAPWQTEGRSWGAVVTDRNGLDVLLAPDVNPGELAVSLESARENYDILCVDLSGATPAQASEVVRASEAIFFVTGSSSAALEAVREKLQAWHSLQPEERSALLLFHQPGGLSAPEAEDLTGLPLCSLVDTTPQIVQLAAWLGQSSQDSSREMVA